MRRQIAWAALLGAMVLWASARPADAEGWADNLFSEQGHDFGTVPRGAKVRHSFLLTNRLAETITILDVRASCGCTSGKAATSTVPAGHTAVVEAEMDTRNFVGPKATVLYVTLLTASGQQAEVRLGVQSNILSDIVLNPGTVDFGTVARGQKPSQILTIDRIGAPQWRVEKMVSASRVLSASLVETARNESTVSYALSVSIKPDAPAGAVRDEIRIVTNDPETPSFPIMVTAQVRGDLSASPSLLMLGNVMSAGGAQGRYVVRASKPFRIRSIEGVGDGFKITAPDAGEPKTLHLVNVAYRPEEGRTRGDVRRVFRIATDLPGEVPLDVTASLHVEP